MIICNRWDKAEQVLKEILITWNNTLRVCPRERQAIVQHAISPIAMKLCQFKGSTPNLKKKKLVSVLVFSGGRKTTPPVVLGFHQVNRFKIGKMYEALSAMVFNQLL